MRKIISTAIATLAVGFGLSLVGGAPAFADTCTDSHTGAVTPCPVTDPHPTAGVCYDPHGYVISCYDPHALAVFVAAPVDSHPTATLSTHSRLRHRIAHRG
jgi:hypothetical protein